MSFNQNKVPIQQRSSANHVPNASSVYIGLVRENQDPQRMGRLLVWISDFGPDLEENWITVSYASPFAGVTPMVDVDGEKDTMEASQKSYGWWATPPDRDNQVLCCFVNGDTTNGFYFACLYPQNMNHMVPGIGFGVSTDTSANDQFSTYDPPVVEYNKKRAEENTVTSTAPNGAEGTSVQRPVFTPLAEGLLAQGLDEDPERGISNTSARRESPSHVFGLLSPRGNTIHIDDGFAENGSEPQNEFIRFRTRSGAQILIHETSGYIYLITKGGNSWVEISDGGIDTYSSGPISMRSGGDVNIHADGAINMHGTTGINMKAAILTSYTSGNTNFAADGDFLVESLKDTFFIAGNNFGIEATRDIGMMADHDILMAACGVISRNAEGILDNSSGGMPEPAKHAEYVEGSVTSRVPTHEPFGHFDGSGAGGGGDGFGGTPSVDVTDSEGNTKQHEIPFDINSSLLDYIARYESVNGSYDSAAPGAIINGLSRKTLGEVIDISMKRRAPGAVGRYQFVTHSAKTLQESMRNTGLKESDIFSPTNQDKMAAYLVNKRKEQAQHGNGGLTITNFAQRLSMEWAGLPSPHPKNGGSPGRSYYAGDGRNGTSASLSQFLALLRKQYPDIKG